MRERISRVWLDCDVQERLLAGQRNWVEFGLHAEGVKEENIEIMIEKANENGLFEKVCSIKTIDWVGN